MASSYWSSVSADEINATEAVTESVTPESTATEPATEEQPPDSSTSDVSSIPPSDESISDDLSTTTTPVDNSTTTLSAGNSTSPSAEVPTTSADNSTNTVPASDSTTTTTLAGNSTSDESISDDLSTTTTPVDNSTTTLSAGNSTSPSAEVPTTSADNSTNTVPASDSTTTTTLAGNSTSSEVTQPLPDATLSLQFDQPATETTSIAGDAAVEEKLDVTSLNLDGEGDFVQVTDTNSKELTAMSLSAWVKPDYSGGSSEFTVVSKDKAFVLAINNNIPPYKVAKFSIFDGIKWSTVESTTQVGEEWTHLAATFDSSLIGIYVNGNLESTLPITGVPSLTVNGQLQLTTVDSISSDSDIVIGAYLSEKSGHSETSNQFSGSVDGVRLYDSLLQPTQISEIYNQNIISYYSSEEIQDFALVHDAIEIGKPVTWTQSVVMSEQTESIAVEVPADAQIVQVETSTGESIDLSTIETTTQSAVLDNEVPLASLDSVPEMVQEDKPTELVVINEAATDYTVTFETPAPYTIEEDQSTPELYSKEVTVAHDSTLHYTDVKSYSDIPEDLAAQGTEFKLYWIIDGQRTDVTADPRFAVEFVDTNGNSIVDQMQWIVPQLSEQQFVIEAQITIINVQSYPTIGGNWTVRFTTIGSGDLVITAIDGTTLGESLTADLMFIELNNGTHTLTPTIDGNSIIYHDYSSIIEGFGSFKVLTPGVHHLQFTFGNDIEYANNFAGTQDAVVAYRSTSQNGINFPKIKFWDSTGPGEWSSEIQLPSAGSPIRFFVVKNSPVSEKIVLVTESDDGMLDAYVCPSSCSNAVSWTVNNIGTVEIISNVRSFDLDFETSTGDAILVYAVKSSIPSEDVGYRVLPAASTAFNSVQYINDPGSGNIKYTWMELDRNPSSSSEELVLAGFDDTNNDINAWVWSGNGWGNFKELTDHAMLHGKEGLDVKYARTGNTAMVVGGDEDGEVKFMRWSGSWSLISSFDTDPSDNKDATWLTLSAEPSTDHFQLVAIDSGKDLHTAYWSGDRWSITSNIDRDVDSGNKRVAAFAWTQSGSGKLVWDTDRRDTTLYQRTCSPQCNSATSQISTYTGSGRWLDLSTNPDATDSVKILAVRQNSANNLGSFMWDDSSFTNYGDAILASNTQTGDLPVFYLDFKPSTGGPQNIAPVLTSIDPKSVNEDLLLTFTALATDSDILPQTLTYTLVGAPAGASIDPVTGVFTWTPTEAQGPGVYIFDVKVTDNGAPPLSDSETITVTVNEINVAPVLASIGDKTVDELTTLSFTASATDSDLPANTITYTLVGAPAGASIDPVTGVFTWTPTEAQGPGVYPFSVRATDNGSPSLFDTKPIIVTVNEANVAPVPVDDTYSVDEDSLLDTDAEELPSVLANDIDADGNPLTAEIETEPSHGTLTLNADGSFTYVPDANYNGPDSFDYIASDSFFDVFATVNITVNPVNDLPTEQDDAYSTNEDTTLNVAAPGVLENDSDLDGDSLSAGLVSDVEHGTLSLDEDGSFTYTPDENFNGIDSFSYSADDGFVVVNTSTVTITIAPINDNPVAVNDTPTTPEDTPITISVLSNDVDVDGDTLSVVSASTPAHGTVVINPDGTITYTPNTNYNGLDSFTYTITDGSTFSTASVTITVTPVNDFPVASSDSTNTPENTATIVAVLSNDVDVDGDTLSVVSILVAPTNGIAVINPDGTITYTPNLNFNGIDSLVYVISDGNGGTASATLTINVEAVNNSPVAVNDTPTTPEDTPITISVLSNDVDVDGDTLSVVSASTPAHGTVVINPDGTITYTPNTNYNGLDSFTYTITDGLEFDTATVTVNITPVNDPPVASSDSTNTPEDTPITISVLSNDVDVDGDTLSVTSILVAPTNGIAVLNLDGTITYTPNTNFNGVDSFTYKANDGTADSNVAAVTVDVGAINDAPVANSQSISTNEDTLLHIILSASDSDGNVFTFTILSGPSNGILTGTAPDLTYTPFANYNGPDSFTFKVNDGLLDSAIATVDITVNSVNDAPILTAIGNKVVLENTLLTFTAVATDSADVPSNSLTFSLTGSVPAGASINSATGIFTWTPTAAQGPGVYTFDVRVTDNGSPPLSDSETITVTVTQLGPSIVSLTASDPDASDAVFSDGDTITVTFNEPTNRPTVAITTDLNNLFTFSQSIGTGYTGSWSSKSVLVITILDKTGGNPTIGGLTLTVNAGANLKNEAGTSLASTAVSPTLTGSFGSKAGPSIISIIAADPDASDAIFSDGDTITVRFSEPTNTPDPTPLVAGLSKADLDNLFTFSQGVASLGTSYSGVWQNSRTLVITINNAAGGTATVGVLTLTVKASANLIDAAGTSLPSTSISSLLGGTFGQKAGPFITSLIAKDPFGQSLGFGNGDAITVKFSEPTNTPDPTPLVAGLSKADLDTLFTFSQSIGDSYTGTWFDPLTLEITITDVGVATDGVGVLTLTVKESGNLKNIASTSLSSTAVSPVLSGTFATKPGPSIVSIKANDPDGLTAGESGGLTNGDTITVTFSEATNRPFFDPVIIISKTNIDNLFTFSPLGTSLGTSYTGKWKNPLTLEITISDATGGTASIGALTLTVNAGANLKNAENTSLVSTSISPTLTGSFGEKEGPSIKSLVADDPDNSDSIFSNGDTLNIRFNEPTNTPDPAPPGLSKADLDNLFTFSQEIGDSYSGSWIDSSTLVITILDSTTDSPPEVGALRLTVKAGGNLKDAASSSLPSTAVSPFLSGSFGTFIEVIPVGDGGTAYTTLPSGISTSITLPGSNSGVMTFERATGFTPPDSILIGILGDVVEITPSGGANCALGEGCELSFEFTTNDAVSNGLTPPTVKVLHDADDNGVFDTTPASPEVLDGNPLGEEDTTVTSIDNENFVAFPAFGHDLWRAIAVAHSNSKFAIGGVKALLGASLLTGGGGNTLPPSVVTVTFSGNDQSSSTGSTVIGFGGRLAGSNLSPGTFKTGEPVKLSSSKIIKTGDPLTLKLVLQEEEGASAIEHVAFYVNLLGNEPQVDNSDTYVIYEKSKPITVVDPHGFFSEVNVVTSQIDAMTLALIYDIKFAKPMATSDIIIRSWDIKRNVDDTKILDALEVVEPGTLPRTIPEWVKNNANWWSSGQIADSDFVQGVQYLIKQGIVTIPETEAGSDSSQQIPTWIKNNAGWWAEGLISDDDFISAMQWLITNGIMKV